VAAFWTLSFLLKAMEATPTTTIAVTRSEINVQFGAMTDRIRHSAVTVFGPSTSTTVSSVWVSETDSGDWVVQWSNVAYVVFV